MTQINDTNFIFWMISNVNHLHVFTSKHYSLLFSYFLTSRSFCLILLFRTETRVIQNNFNFLLLLGNELLKLVFFFSLSCLFFLSCAGRWALGLVAPPAVNAHLRHGQAWRFSTVFYQQAESCWLISFSSANLFSQPLKRRQQLFVAAFNSS